MSTNTFLKPAVVAAYTERRIARRSRQLGIHKVCVRCGFSNPAAIVDSGRTNDPSLRALLLEEHHIFGRHLDPNATITLCRNCHGVVTESLRATGVPMHRPRTMREAMIAMLRALAALFQGLAKTFLMLAEWLLWGGDLSGPVPVFGGGAS